MHTGRPSTPGGLHRCRLIGGACWAAAFAILSTLVCGAGTPNPTAPRGTPKALDHQAVLPPCNLLRLYGAGPRAARAVKAVASRRRPARRAVPAPAVVEGRAASAAGSGSVGQQQVGEDGTRAAGMHGGDDNLSTIQGPAVASSDRYGEAGSGRGGSTALDPAEEGDMYMTPSQPKKQIGDGSPKRGSSTSPRVAAASLRKKDTASSPARSRDADGGSIPQASQMQEQIGTAKHESDGSEDADGVVDGPGTPVGNGRRRGVSETSKGGGSKQTSPRHLTTPSPSRVGGTTGARTQGRYESLEPPTPAVPKGVWPEGTPKRDMKAPPTPALPKDVWPEGTPRKDVNAHQTSAYPENVWPEGTPRRDMNAPPTPALPKGVWPEGTPRKDVNSPQKTPRREPLTGDKTLVDDSTPETPSSSSESSREVSHSRQRGKNLSQRLDRIPEMAHGSARELKRGSPRKGVPPADHGSHHRRMDAISSAGGSGDDSVSDSVSSEEFAGEEITDLGDENVHRKKGEEEKEKEEEEEEEEKEEEEEEEEKDGGGRQIKASEDEVEKTHLRKSPVHRARRLDNRAQATTGVPGFVKAGAHGSDKGVHSPTGTSTASSLESRPGHMEARGRMGGSSRALSSEESRDGSADDSYGRGSIQGGDGQESSSASCQSVGGGQDDQSVSSLGPHDFDWGKMEASHGGAADSDGRRNDEGDDSQLSSLSDGESNSSSLHFDPSLWPPDINPLPKPPKRFSKHRFLEPQPAEISEGDEYIDYFKYDTKWNPLKWEEYRKYPAQHFPTHYNHPIFRQVLRLVLPLNGTRDFSEVLRDEYVDHYDKYGDAVFKKPLPRHMLDSEWGFEGVPADIQGYEYANADMLFNKSVEELLGVDDANSKGVQKALRKQEAEVNAGREWHHFKRADVPWQNDTSLRQDFKMLRKRDDWDPKQHYKNIGWERKGTNVKSKHKVVWPKLYQMGEVVRDEKNPRENLPKALQGKSLTEQLLADERIRENLQKKFRKRQEISGGWHLKKSEGGTGREGQKKRRIIPQAPKEGAESIKQMMDDKDYQDALDNREREDSDEGYVPPDEGPEPWRVIKPKHIMEGDTPEMAMWREKATWGGKGSRARQKRADAKRRLEALEERKKGRLHGRGDHDKIMERQREKQRVKRKKAAVPDRDKRASKTRQGKRVMGKGFGQYPKR